MTKHLRTEGFEMGCYRVCPLMAPGLRHGFLRGIGNVEQRSIIHIARFNLGVLLRTLFGFGTLKGLG